MNEALKIKMQELSHVWFARQISPGWIETFLAGAQAMYDELSKIGDIRTEENKIGEEFCKRLGIQRWDDIQHHIQELQSKYLRLKESADKMAENDVIIDIKNELESSEVEASDANMVHSLADKIASEVIPLVRAQEIERYRKLNEGNLEHWHNLFKEGQKEMAKLQSKYLRLKEAGELLAYKLQLEFSDEEIADKIVREYIKSYRTTVSEIEKITNSTPVDLNATQKVCDECKGTGEPTRKHSDLSTVCEDCRGSGVKEK